MACIFLKSQTGRIFTCSHRPELYPISWKGTLESMDIAPVQPAQQGGQSQWSWNSEALTQATASILRAAGTRAPGNFKPTSPTGILKPR